MAERNPHPRKALEETFLAFYDSAVEHQLDTQLLMRELQIVEAAADWQLAVSGLGD